MFAKPLLFTTLITAALLCSATQPAAQAADPEPLVTLTIDFGDGSQLRFTRLKHSEGMTVLDALTAASKHPRGVKFKSRGSGEIAFVSAIDGQENEGANRRNWLFKVDDQLAKVSAGKQKLAAGAEVEWLFAKYDELQ